MNSHKRTGRLDIQPIDEDMISHLYTLPCNATQPSKRNDALFSGNLQNQATGQFGQRPRNEAMPEVESATPYKTRRLPRVASCVSRAMPSCPPTGFGASLRLAETHPFKNETPLGSNSRLPRFSPPRVAARVLSPQ